MKGEKLTYEFLNFCLSASNELSYIPTEIGYITSLVEINIRKPNDSVSMVGLIDR